MGGVRGWVFYVRYNLSTQQHPLGMANDHYAVRNAPVPDGKT